MQSDISELDRTISTTHQFREPTLESQDGNGRFGFGALLI
jgi:hypothetical protein